MLSQWYLGICVQARKSLKSYRACVELEVLVIIVQAVRYVKFYKVYFPRVEPKIFGGLGSAH